ncbi:MAG: isoaspartyl peptidase/L-asparaginase [Ignavibacteriaceae bacterium]|nr:isoaspartyl peptidase/L-asparaginase [Ignavibacteriaceae bacterium]
MLLILLFICQTTFSQQPNGKYTVVIHGGAGSMDPNMEESSKQSYINSLTAALNIGKEILEKGGSSLDAVEQVVRFLEDDSLFNAGRGAVFTAEGKNELDASIMDGRDLSSGAVAGVTIIKNPISLARLVMEKTQHVLFAGNGADNLGMQLGVEIVDPSYFFVHERFNELKRMTRNVKGTVGCVAIDQYGNIAAATSTGGRTGKMPGRVGDSPLINAGTYANNKTCGISATGHGELFIKNTVAYQVSALMEFKGLSLKQAADEVIHQILPKGSGGIIAVDKNYNFEFPFNTSSMMRGVATSDGVFEVKIWK